MDATANINAEVADNNPFEDEILVIDHNELDDISDVLMGAASKLHIARQSGPMETVHGRLMDAHEHMRKALDKTEHIIFNPNQFFIHITQE